MSTLPVTTHGDKHPHSVPDAALTGWRKTITTQRCQRLIWALLVINILISLGVIISIFVHVNSPYVNLHHFAGVQGAYTIETNITGHPVLAWRRSNDSDIESLWAYLSVENRNIYPIKVFEPQFYVNAPAAPWKRIANATEVQRPTNVKEANVVSISGGATDLIQLKAEITWNLTDVVSSRVLTKGLLDCNLNSSLLPPRMVAQAKDPNLGSALNVHISLYKVTGPFVQANPLRLPQDFPRPAKDLLCPLKDDPSESNRVLADALCRAWGDCEVDRKVAVSKNP
ncbi:hypothetical protein GGF31_001283 [Allomyces arbusculus]|nr:hypothetical protein GGF31_001283 [Allomyces arbusculus]